MRCACMSQFWRSSILYSSYLHQCHQAQYWLFIFVLCHCCTPLHLHYACESGYHHVQLWYWILKRFLTKWFQEKQKSSTRIKFLALFHLFWKYCSKSGQFFLKIGPGTKLLLEQNFCDRHTKANYKVNSLLLAHSCIHIHPIFDKSLD